MKAHVSAAVLAALGALSTPALAHIVLVSPPPRDVGLPGADSHKKAPCGGVARSKKYTKYAPGATVKVDFTETVDHRGCFQVGFSEAGDANFTILPGSQTDDPAGDAVPKARSITVALPTKECKQCTLQLRQLMLGAACVSNQTPGATDTYYSCADICIGTDCPIIPPEDAGASSSGGGDSGVSTTPVPPTNPTERASSSSGGTSSGGVPRLDGGKGRDCAVGWGGPAGESLAAVGLFALLAAARRRRRPR